MEEDTTGKTEKSSRFLVKELQKNINGSFLFRLTGFFICYFVIIPLAFLLGKAIYHLKMKGRGNLRGIKGCMVAANHCQFVEPGFAMVSLFPRKVIYPASEMNVTRKSIGWFIRLTGALGIPDENPLRIAPYIKEALRCNRIICFYPEGELSWRSQAPGPFFKGFFFLAVLNDVPVLPLTEVLKERLIRRIFPWWPPKTTFVLGAPVHPNDFKRPGLSKKKQAILVSEHVRSVIINTIEKEGGCKTLAESQDSN